ncbi:carcinoembryonic antigen-related cell adhesion molecule 1-like isoform X3 [Ranitomeya imitator]|uniref:carcinoembryonic antigen-related cell adhesion molecule 1-like isoform X3 n=1 Tax=Ranitomeya imitator TaxID=111125 RepID=UPI0037E98CD9
MGLLLWSVFLGTIGMVATIRQFNASIGGTAFISPSSPASPDHRIDWNFDIAGSTIATLIPSSSPTYAGRCNGGKCRLFTNGTLQMDQLVSSENRSYSVSLQFEGKLIKEEVKLNVYNLLTPPSLIVSSSIRPVNGTTLNLKCNPGTQTVHSIYFYRNDELLSCSSSHLSCSSSNVYLYFNPILGSDTGIYTCGIENPVSSNRSTGRYLDVAVHVSGVTLRSNASGPVIAEKEAVSLVCSSYGTDVSYNWTLMELPLPQNPRYHLTNGNSTLVISPVMRSDRGSFTCRVSNYLNSQLSNPLNLTWSPEGNIECRAEHLDQSVQLYCLWPGGYPPAVVHLMYENIVLSGADNSTAVVPTNQFSPGAPLSCSGSHVGSSEMCLLAIDIPRSTGFINDSINTANKGNSAVLSVTLNSGNASGAQIFPATFSWVRLDPTPSKLITTKDIIIMSNDYSSYMIIQEMNEEFNGKYMCRAENPIGSNYFTFFLNAKKEEILSAGAIAGIVIGSIVALTLIILVLILVFRKDKINNTNNAAEPPSAPHPKLIRKIQRRNKENLSNNETRNDNCISSNEYINAGERSMPSGPENEMSTSTYEVSNLHSIYETLNFSDRALYNQLNNVPADNCLQTGHRRQETECNKGPKL